MNLRIYLEFYYRGRGCLSCTRVAVSIIKYKALVGIKSTIKLMRLCWHIFRGIR